MLVKCYSTLTWSSFQALICMTKPLQQMAARLAFVSTGRSHRSTSFLSSIYVIFITRPYLARLQQLRELTPANMEAYGGRAPETYSDPVPDLVKQFVVYLYRHIRYRAHVDTSEVSF